MQDRYVSCYIAGRMDEYEGEVDVEKLVERACSGASVRDITMEAARKAISTERGASAKVEWLKDNLDEIKGMGGDSEKAWQKFCQGRADALAAQLEDEVVEGVVGRIEEEEDEEEEPEDESDEDEESDDDSDDDEEEDEEDA